MHKPTREMSDRHESFLARLFGGRITKASGATTDKGDGRQHKHEQTYCFAWDGKSTRATSISVKTADWDKVREQTVGYRPMLPIRFYRDDRLVEVTDLVVLDAHDAAELIEVANGAVNMEAVKEAITDHWLKCAQMTPSCLDEVLDAL